jgi:SNF2 family DNA or RNA helicase
VARAIPQARQLNGSAIAVPINLYNLQMLRWLHLPVVPIMDKYDWPHGPHIPGPTQVQKIMANFMALHPRAFNLSDMGTMKTLATLWAADFVMSHFPKGECRAVVATPLSILERVWGQTIFKNMLGRRTYKIVHGTAARRSEILGEPADFYIINFDGLTVGSHRRKKFELDGFSKELAARSDIRIAIIDEASAYRDSRTLRHRVARAILYNKSYLWLLTGTPNPNGPVDAYGLAKLVNDAYGEKFTHYKQRVMIQISPFKWIPRFGANAEARKLLTPAIRFSIKDVWDGPPRTTQQRDIDLTSEQKKAMHELKRHLQVEVATGPITAVNEAVARQKFIQISLGAIYDSEHRIHEISALPRLRECEQVIENAGRKVLIFSPLTSIVNLLHRELSKKWTCTVVNGTVLRKERDDRIKKFGHEPDPRILIADPGTVAHGINDFVSADTVIWYGPTDKTEQYIQGNARVHRPGQQYPVTIVQLVSNAVEREIFRRLENNESTQGVLLDMVRKGQF